MRLVIIGIAPVRAGEEGQPLSALRAGATGHRLAELASMSASEFMMSTDRINLCAGARRSTISVSEGRPLAEMLAGSFLRGRSVILLGSNVAECFGLRRTQWEWLEWNNLKDWRSVSHSRGWAGFKAGMPLPFNWAVLPHPSGRNRWYNDLSNWEQANMFMTEAINLTRVS